MNKMKEEKKRPCFLAIGTESFLRRQLRGKACFRAPTHKCPEALDGRGVLTGERQAEQHFQSTLPTSALRRLMAVES